MPLETVRDNQWWYSQSVHRPRVETCGFVMLSIGGRECPLVHSELGCDGRPTHSFKFLNAADRAFWVALRGNQVDINVIECGDQLPELDQADEAEQADEPGTPQLLEMPIVCRGGDTLFDAYVFIDWSASSRPKTGADSVWIGAGAYDANGNLVVDRPINPRTRQQAETRVCELLVEHTKSQRRVLVGFDFPYGYPANWHTAIGTNAGTWQGLWNLLVQQITDNGQNTNNRCDVANDLNAAVVNFAGPFWSRPNVNAALYPSLPATKPHCFANALVAEFREIEQRLRATGRQPKSVWQLFGNGVVGSQVLLGIPVLFRLHNHEQLRACSQVWPFETGWQCPVSQRPCVVHAEIWPGAIPVARGLHPIKDAAQVLSYVYWAARLDVGGNLNARFNPHAAPPAAVVQQCEGWILGQ
jgi:hypothetical protein